MIISASYKTDIPTFYGDWFLNRLRAGYCKMVNPWNRKQAIRVSLDRRDVDGVVFWTKNISPFIDHLKEVHKRGFPFIIQHSINAYPKALEFSVVNARRSVEALRRLAEQYGPRVCVWRYDTIIVSSLTPLDFHRRNFESLCRDLEGTTDEVVISFVHLYQKTLRNMNGAASEFGFEWEDPPAETKRQLASEMVEMARARGMKLAICAQRDYLVPGAADARCIDAERLESVAGKVIKAERCGGRKECGCFASKDIGDYDTCPHGCVYCYAVVNRPLAQARFRQHDPEGEFLFPVHDAVETPPEPATRSLPLFDDPGPETT
jgi:hypothetical protein